MNSKKLIFENQIKLNIDIKDEFSKNIVFLLAWITSIMTNIDELI